jgi:hypothetical protein
MSLDEVGHGGGMMLGGGIITEKSRKFQLFGGW